MEYWDIYDEKKQKTGRTMTKNGGPAGGKYREAESTREKIPGTQ